MLTGTHRGVVMGLPRATVLHKNTDVKFSENTEDNEDI